PAGQRAGARDQGRRRQGRTELRARRPRGVPLDARDRAARGSDGGGALPEERGRAAQGGPSRAARGAGAARPRGRGALPPQSAISERLSLVVLAGGVAGREQENHHDGDQGDGAVELHGTSLSAADSYAASAGAIVSKKSVGVR